MPGPAVTRLFYMLAEIPKQERTPEQKELVEELALHLASRGDPEQSQEHLELRAKIRSELKIKELGSFTFTRPDPERDSKICTCCGQPLPNSG